MTDINQAFQKAINLQKEGKLKEAESIYIDILKSDSNHVPTLINLGLIEQNQGKLDEASQFYKYAFSIEPNNISLLYLLAKITQELNQLDEAIIYWQKLAELKPDSALEFYGNIGNSLVQQGKFDQALNYFHRALEISPKSFQAHQAIGNLLIRQDKLLEAKSEFSRALEINPNYQVAKVWLTLVDKLLKGDNLVSFNYQNTLIKFEITGKNLAVEIANVGGSFYELAELEFIRQNLKSTAPVIVDVGANTGNHLVYFGKIIQAAKIIPIEFHPEIIAALKRHISINQVGNIDLSKLGYAIGKNRGKSFIKEHPAKDLFLTEIDNKIINGQELVVVPLDEIITEKVDFIKIDVQGKEIDVLEGAKNLISSYRPDMLVEVAKNNIKDFRKFLAAVNYQTVKAFDHGRYVNFYIKYTH
ncbi:MULTISPECIES: FkbM family methyltransferase [Okeania]|uniref:FkbM family methyltransferase n=1 Tax=Okeania hirsuta TaxID=1458930 RepID=A0A3N6P8Z2_9CYAN|nr:MULTISPECIES: FkbM family methyltransferase [Okeania]NES79446.1 FkbM family methyltransferase [Okeania sp. SIO1H4]NET23286.1 FkbM family methyltransferase [Okeania sp. SIO1H5]NET79898.1 FkbM family methyltransferase [Okeania sp. SIO1F9]NET96759.1 FkbM family methyltransferase [Okeania sp. SIO1H2]RQH20302.1 FkbM family methyltransferase [Okeania hirsuta]